MTRLLTAAMVLALASTAIPASADEQPRRHRRAPAVERLPDGHRDRVYERDPDYRDGREYARERYAGRDDDRDWKDRAKARREAIREFEKDRREALREREKDRREWQRERDKDAREQWREYQKDHRESEKEWRKRQRERDRDRR